MADILNSLAKRVEGWLFFYLDYFSPCKTVLAESYFSQRILRDLSWRGNVAPS
jgi:hypothetical protein